MECGLGAQCVISNIGTTCSCPEGSIGNPFPGGKCIHDICSRNEPCDEDNVCINGRCKQKCEGIVCGIGAYCDPLSNKCSCYPFFDGNPDLLCMPRKLILCVFFYKTP